MARPHDIDQEILIQAEAAFFSFWCVFRLCFLANFRFLWNLGSQPETKQIKIVITNKVKRFTLHAHMPPGGGLLDSTTVVLPGLKHIV